MKKLVVLLPVVVLALLFLKVESGLRGKASLAFSLCIMFLVFVIGVYKKKQETFLQGFIQSTFLVYIFMVLTLTGYFTLFREVAAHGWWHRVLHRIQTKEKINLHPFLMFKQFQIGSTQVIGNLVMLLPLGIYIPLLFPGLSGFFRVFLICLLVSISIELMQLITNVRSTDIDDVILNTSGAVVGYIIYKLLRLIN
jgi:glycopeptide antibiotics resistance protein